MQGLNIQFVRKTTYREIQSNNFPPGKLESIVATRNIEDRSQGQYSTSDRNFNNFKELRFYNNARACQRKPEFIVLSRSDRPSSDFGNRSAC